jgi:hypothetical protein
MLLVGTYAMTKKKSHTANDFPLMKVNGTSKDWVPEAEIVHRPSHNAKDKKLGGFLHSHLVNDTKDHRVQRWLQAQKKLHSISSHELTTDFSYHMNGVDHKDIDTVDQMMVSLKLNQFYFRNFYWLFYSALHGMYSIIKVVACNKTHPWHKYRSKHLECYNFQMDLR